MSGRDPESVKPPEGGRVLVLVNPVSAGGRGARVWAAIADAVRRRRPGAGVHITRSPGDAEGVAAAWAGGNGGDGAPAELVVVGGDGTLHEAVNGLARAGRLDVRIGVIPAGTGNDFARSNGLPAGPAALTPALDAGIRQVDLGRIRFCAPGGAARERLFLNSASLGLSVRGNAIAHRLRRRLPSSVCYVLGGIGAVLSERRRDRRCVRMEVDGREVYAGAAVNVTVANGETFGSGLPIAPGASIRDGMLDQVVVGDVGRLGAARAFLALLRAKHVGLPCVRRTGGRRVRIALAGPAELEADGCMLEAVGDVAIEVLPAALRLGSAIPGH